MTKLNITRLDSVTSNDAAATAAINNNFQAVQTAIENTLSRDGTTPNFMNANLDLNAHRILNVADPVDANDVITKGWFDEFVGDAASAAEAAVSAATAAASSAQASAVSAMNAAAEANLAADRAEIAKDWATKMDGTVDGEDYSAKYYASQIIPIATDISTVASISTDIEAVADNASDISSVATNITNVNTVAGIAEDISDVIDIASDIAAVSTNAEDISTVATNITAVTAVADNETNINAVASNATNINTVATNTTDITAVATSIADISSVADSLTDIATVNTNISDISTVATNITDVTAVADNLTTISAVDDNKTNINAVAGNATNINTVASISSDVTTVASNTSNIASVLSNISDITAVADDVTNIDTVASNITNVNSVASNATNINTVASNSTNINTVAADTASINAIAADLTNIDNASTYANNSNIWAEGTDEQVQTLGGVHSSKGWAEVSSQGQIQADWNEVDTSSKAYINNKPNLATVATTGSYSDLSNTPTIPSVDQSYSSSSANAQSGTAVAEALATIEALPSQTGNAGKCLLTDGTDASWGLAKGVENVRNDSFIGTWQGTEQEWQQAETTTWRKWQTDIIAGTYTSRTESSFYAREQFSLIDDGTNLYMTDHSTYGGDARLWKSTDGGETWTDTQRTLTAEYNFLAYTNGIYVVVSSTSSSGNPLTLTVQAYSGSEAFETAAWQSGGTLSISTLGVSSYQTLFTCDNKFFVLGNYTGSANTYYFSSDGINWTSKTFPNNYSNTTHPRSKIVKFNNTYLCLTYGGNELLAKSTDLDSWTYEDIRDTWGWSEYNSYMPQDIDTNGTVVSIVAKSSYYAKIFSTSDLQTWSNVWTRDNGTLDRVLQQNGLFIAGSADGSGISMSSDGLNWSTYKSGNYFNVNHTTQITDDEIGCWRGMYHYYWPLSSSSCYTLDVVPTTASTIYSAPSTPSALTVVTGGSDAIVLSDNQTYNRNSAGDISSYQTAGDLYPNHLAFINGKGVKKGNTTIIDTSSIADTNLSNLTATGKSKAADLCSPDYTAGTTEAWNTLTTAPKAGLVIANAYANQSTLIQVDVNGVTLPYYLLANAGVLGLSFPVAKGDEWKVYGGNAGYEVKFYPMKGEL